MADKKISELTNITGSTIADTDEFVVVDASANETKAITASELRTAIGNGDFTVTGNLTVQGTTITVDSASAQNIVLGDNDKMTFGAGADLQIYSDGDHSYISETGITGSLYIDGTNLRLRSTAGDVYLKAVSDGAVDLYYDNSPKLATTATGVDITGTLTSDGLTVDGNNDIQINRDGVSSAKIFWDRSGTQDAAIELNASEDLIISVDDAGLTGKSLVLKNNSKTGLVLASGGDISFYEDTGITPKFYWDASAESLGIGTTTVNADLHLGAASPHIDIGPSAGNRGKVGFDSNNVYIGSTSGTGEIHFKNNIGSTDAPHSSGDTKMVITDSGVGIGTISPSGFFHVKDASSSFMFKDVSGNAELFIDGSNGDFAGGDYFNIVADSSPNLMFKQANTERMRIDSSGKVGIGTSSSASGGGIKLNVNGSSGGGIQLTSNNNGGSAIIPLTAGGQSFYTFTGAVGSETYTEVMRIASTGELLVGTTSDTMPAAAAAGQAIMAGTRTFIATETGGDTILGGTTGSNFTAIYQGGTERMRIDSSGNLLHDTTTYSGASSPQNSSSSADAGTVIEAGGTVQIGRYQNSPLRLNRMNNDGAIAEFRKDGAAVGSIGTASGYMYLGDGNGATGAGLHFVDTGIRPYDAKNNSSSDAEISLGVSGARFKDLYLSGGVYLGGTGAANHLDDYEEGTWTVTTNVGTITANTGFYTKIGDLVYFTAVVGVFSDTSSSSEIQLSLPFTSSSTSGLNNHGSVMARYISKSDKSLVAYIGANSNYVNIYANGTNGDNWSALTYSDLTNGSAYLRFSICFKV